MSARDPRGPPYPEEIPTPDEIASLLQVEHLLDQRWPETKLEPSTARISALMELLGSPQLGFPSIHIAGTNGKTSVARMVDALLTAFNRRTGRTTRPHLQSGAVRGDLPRDRTVRAACRPAVGSGGWPGDEQVRGGNGDGVRRVRRRSRRH